MKDKCRQETISGGVGLSLSGSSGGIGLFNSYKAINNILKASKITIANGTGTKTGNQFNLIDDSVSTTLALQYGIGSVHATITFDLGQVVVVNNILLRWQLTNAGVYSDTYTFNLEYSNDDSSYTSILTRNYTATGINDEAAGIVAFRYLRIRTSGSVGGDPSITVYEVVANPLQTF